MKLAADSEGKSLYRLCAVERLVRERLEGDYPFPCYLATISLEFNNDTLTLLGTLPSYYAKQLLQETILAVPGITHIKNNVEVTNRRAG